MTFSSLDLSFSHTYGLINGIYLATLVFLVFFMLSYLSTRKERYIAKAMGLSTLMFVFFGLYNLSFQGIHGAITTHIFSDALLRYGIFGAPLGLYIAIFIVERYMKTQSIFAYRLLKKIKISINLLYAIIALTLIALIFLKDMRIAHALVMLSFIPSIIIGFLFFLKSLKGNIRNLFLVVFAFYMLSTLTFSVLLFKNTLHLPPHFFMLAHSLFSLSTLALGFAIIRFGYKGAYGYGQVKDTDPLNITNQIYSGIDKQQFFMVYQPKKHLATGNICGVEALIRWRHPKHGLIPPDQFIHIAEKTRQINTLCKWTITQIVQQAKYHHEQGYFIPISLNFSVINLNANVVNFLLHEMQKYKVRPDSVIIEITESLMLDLNDRVRQSINLLHKSGVHISLDDYGAGFSSLSYLRKLYVNELKIDRGFINDLITNADNQAIVESTIQMAHKMGIRVVAEGVEDDDTYHLLKEIHCNMIQGYFLAKPMPAADLMQWLADNQAG